MIDNNEEILLNLIKSLYVERDVKKSLESLTTPYGLRKYINLFSWRDFLDDYVNSVNKKYEIELKIKKNFSDDFIKKINVKFKSGLEFILNAENSSDFLKPILNYYGLNQVYSGFIDLLFEKPPKSKRPSHGLKNAPKIENGLIQWLLKINIKDSFFRKLIITIDTLEGFPKFAEIFLDISNNPSKNNFGFKIISHTNSERFINLNDNFKQTGKWNYLFDNENYVILNYLTQFALCSTLRYNPDIWIKHIEGDQYMYPRMKELNKNIFYDINYFLKKIQRPLDSVEVNPDLNIQKAENNIRSNISRRNSYF